MVAYLMSLVLVLVGASATWTVDAASPVVSLLRKEAQQGERVDQAASSATDHPMPADCALLAESGGTVSKRRADVLADIIANKLENEDGDMLHARAEAARLGLFGFPTDPQFALTTYIRALNTDNHPSGEAGYNAALMLYHYSKGRPNQKVARKILALLTRSGLLELDRTDEVAAQAHYLAATLYREGFLGKPDPVRAFLHDRASADGRYIPGVYSYLNGYSRALLEMPPNERERYLSDFRIWIRRWRWSSLDLLALTARVYQSGLLPDPDHFRAPYYSQILAHWQGQGGRAIRVSAAEGAASAERIEDAVARALRTTPMPPPPKAPQFADRCAPNSTD